MRDRSLKVFGEETADVVRSSNIALGQVETALSYAAESRVISCVTAPVRGERFVVKHGMGVKPNHASWVQREGPAAIPDLDGTFVSASSNHNSNAKQINVGEDWTDATPTWTLSAGGTAVTPTHYEFAWRKDEGSASYGALQIRFTFACFAGASPVTFITTPIPGGYAAQGAYLYRPIHVYNGTTGTHLHGYMETGSSSANGMWTLACYLNSTVNAGHVIIVAGDFTIPVTTATGPLKSESFQVTTPVQVSTDVDFTMAQDDFAVWATLDDMGSWTEDTIVLRSNAVGRRISVIVSHV